MIKNKKNKNGSCLKDSFEVNTDLKNINSLCESKLKICGTVSVKD